ncbi:nitrilase-related carbon-nitrogen hydrolase [Nocardia sp. NPDC020380]|uniref:nitrilase-related carbon-nitrogen hydrolase n=1 Tax=Nocardia sp. NPDC020380 TaxID=3364309 RepID=UPI00379BF1C3
MGDVEFGRDPLDEHHLGVEHEELYGNSMVISPFGKVVARAGKTDEILITDIDLDQIKAANVISGFKKDREVAESYAGKI